MSEFPSPGNLRSAPEDWTRVRLKFAVDYINEKVDFEGDGEYVALENISSWTSIRLPSEAPLEPSSQTNRFQSGDVLFGKLRPYLAKVLLVDFDGYASSECLVLRGKAVLPEFVRYWCLSKDFIELVDGSTFGSKMPRADWDFIGNTVALIPPPPVQQAIAAHLDRETAKIDTLIAKKRELIAKLKEQRSALISRTVTRGLPPEAAKAAGLDPNPPMKDSGVEWFGKVPEHWQISCLKRNWNVLDCKHLTAEFVDDGFPLASIREVQSRFVDLTNAKRTTPDFYFQLIEGDREPRLHDLIFSRNATVGEVAQVPVDQGNFALGQDVCLIRRKHASHSADFLQIVLRSEACRSQLDNVMVGSTFKRVNVEDIKALWIPVPPVNEQLAVANFLLSQLEKVDGLVTTVETAITRLTEYRAALITAAVTGQLDVTSTG